MRLVTAFALALVLMLTVAACGGGEEVSPEPETVEGEVQEEQTVGEGDAAAGKTVFTNEANPACGSCHTFQAAGTNGQTGPNLDEALADDDPQSINESIVNPNAEIAEGFQEGVMPEDYGDKLSDKQLADLVAFLNENKGG